MKKGSGAAVLSLSEDERKQRKNERVKLEFNKLQAALSFEELSFCRISFDTGHTSGVYFTDPGAPFCYRCPLFLGIINWAKLPVSVRPHFNRIHGERNQDFLITFLSSCFNPRIRRTNSKQDFGRNVNVL